MKLCQNNYKGKWFVLSDEPDDMYGDIGTIDSDEVNLEEHADACLYYGIPMYSGSDKDFNKKCNEVMVRAIERDEESYKLKK
jgi:hypothetical protein